VAKQFCFELKQSLKSHYAKEQDLQRTNLFCTLSTSEKKSILLNIQDYWYSSGEHTQKPTRALYYVQILAPQVWNVLH
jgi:hypothetical protein